MGVDAARRATRAAAVAALLPWVAGLGAAASGAERRPVTVDELLGLRIPGEVRLSPGGKTVLFVVSHADFERDAWIPELFAVDASGGEPRRLAPELELARPRLPNPQPSWSPDGSRVAVLAVGENAAGPPQVYVIDPRSGDARAVTAAERGVVDYRWLPDSRGFVFASPQPPSQAEERLRREHRWVEVAGRDDKPVRLHVARLGGSAGTAASPAITPAEHFVSRFDVSPDGAFVVYGAARKAGYADTWRTRLYVVPTAGGAPRPLVDRSGMNDQPRWSPRGDWIAFLTTHPGESILSNLRLAAVPASGGEIRELNRAADHWVGEYTWLPDGSALYYVTDQPPGGSRAAMFEQQLWRVRLESAEVERLTSGRRVITSPSVSRDGRTVAFRSQDSATTGDVHVASTSDWSERRITDIEPRDRELAFGPLEPISWRSFDGMEIWGLLLTPPGDRREGRLPLLVYCHGGPVGGFGYAIYPQFPHRIGPVDPYPMQAFASAGFAVLLPMPRGGSGYGEAGFRMIVGSWGEGDLRDILAGVDHLVAEGVADPERLGIMGASYGGYLTSWAVTQTDRFAAASTGASINDLADLWALSDSGEFLNDYLGKPWEHPEAYRLHSPITFAERVTTPLLIQHGELDFRVPVGQARELYAVLAALGKTVELEVYPRGGHVNQEPDLQREQQRRNLDWFSRWLLGDPPRMPSAPAGTAQRSGE